METPNDPFAFLKAAWPGFSANAMSGGLPQSSLPTTDIEEIDRRIADLKTVEQWLSLNLNILKTTIQGLEIQRGTLAAVQSWQASMADFGKSVPQEEAPAPEAAAQQTQWWWASMQDQFNQLVQAAGAMQSGDKNASSGAKPKAAEKKPGRQKSSGSPAAKKPRASADPS